MGKSPGAQRVGAETGVDHRECADYPGIRQVCVEAFKLGAHEKALIHNAVAVEAGYVEVLPCLFVKLIYGALNHLADDIQLAIELRIVFHLAAAGYEDLADEGLGLAGHIAYLRVVHRDVSPSQKLLPFVRNHLLHDGLASLAALGVRGQKDHADSVFARRGQGYVQLGALLRQEVVGYLNQHACAVSGSRVAAAGAPVRQVDQDLQTVLQNVVRLLAVNVGGQAHSTSVSLKPGIVQTKFTVYHR